MRVNSKAVLDLGKSVNIQLKPGDCLCILSAKNNSMWINKHDYIEIYMTKRGNFEIACWQAGKKLVGKLKLKKTKQ